MKAFRQVISVIMAVLMLVTAVPLASVSAAEEKTENYTLTLENTYNDSLTAGSSSLGQMSFFGSTEFNGCYGNQLPELARELYDSMVKQFATDKKTGEYTHTFGTAFTFKTEISNGEIVMNEELEEIATEISCAMQSAIDAFLYDHPEVFWLRITSSSYGVSASGNSSIGYTGIIDSIDITPSEIYSGASSKLLQYGSAVDASLDAITVTESRYDTLKNIHDYICGNAWYNLVNELRVHSSEAFFIGDGGVVCEGYAKAFKVICDRLGIPCVLVSGDAGGAHMWNYVQMDDGKWYLVDATWDDQKSGIMYTYFLANANTVGFDDVTISEERTERNDFSGTGIFTFTYPVLSETAYTAHVHQWESDYTVDVEPTCTEKGSKSIHCKSCSETKSVTEVEATGHEWNAGVVDIASTCRTQGSKIYTCKNDSDHKRTEQLPLNPENHEGGTTIKNKKAETCTENGYTGDTYCKGCEVKLLSGEVIPATNHRNKEVKAGKEATCTEIGYTAGIYCPDCEEWLEEPEKIPADHVDADADKFCDRCKEYIEELYKTGKCGDNVTYNWYKDGMVIISGSGPMYSYDSDSPFYYVSNIKTVVVEEGITVIGANAFERCYGLVSIILPNSATKISSGAFFCCDGLTEITIPNNVTIIGEEAFYGCSDIQSVTIGNNVTTIDGWAFSACESLMSVNIPDSVTKIGSGAFWGCVSLRNVTIGNGVTTIDNSAFCYCESLTSVTIGDSVTTIGEDTFGYCRNLVNLSIGDSVTVICDKAFSACESLVNVTLPTSVTTIGDYAFYNCYSLTSVTIPNSVTTIGDGVFNNCWSLNSITIPDSVTAIGERAFSYCHDLTNITVDENNQNYSDDEFGVLFNKDKTELIQYPIGNNRSGYTIPDSVTTIANGAFAACDSLTSVTIPDSVTTIDDWAFSFCDPLTDVYYGGISEQWKKINIGIENEALTNANIHFSYCPHENQTAYPQQDPTCTEIGYTAGIYCPDCEEWLEAREEIPALSHDWGEAVTETVATCKTHGIKLYTCKNNSDHKKREQMGLNPENHEGGEYIKDAVKATCTSEGYTGDTCCKGCDVKLSSGEKIERLSHTCRTVTIKATLTENGKTESKCTACGFVESASEIYFPETIRLSSGEVTYNGKVRTPSVIVKDSQGVALVKDLDYTVTYESGRKLPGRYAVTVTFKGNYEGTKELTFTILPKASTTITASQSTSVINLKWSASAGATGYRVYQYSPSKGKYVSVASVKGVTSYRKSTSLKAGTQYSFKIKPYTKLADGTVLWGVASDAFVTATECKAPSITSVTTPSKSKATVKWSNVSGETGYQLYYATSKNGTYKKVKTYGENVLAGSKTFSSSASGKTIYFKVRAYSKVNGQTIFSSWSAVKSVKLK